MLLFFNLPEARLMTIGLVELAEEISRKPSIVCAMQLIVVSLTQINNENE